jgi:hypothetical protein
MGVKVGGRDLVGAAVLGLELGDLDVGEKVRVFVGVVVIGLELRAFVGEVVGPEVNR